MKIRKLNSYRENVGLAIVQESGKTWYQVTTPTNQRVRFRTIDEARADIALWYGPEIKQEQGK